MDSAEQTHAVVAHGLRLKVLLLAESKNSVLIKIAGDVECSPGAMTLRCAPISWQEDGEVGMLSGVILSPDKTPMEGAMVSLAGSVWMDETDKEGRYYIIAPKATYTVDIAKTGYDTMSISSVVIANGVEKVLDIRFEE